MEIEPGVAAARAASPGQGGKAGGRLSWVDALLGLVAAEAGIYALLVWLPAGLTNSWPIDYIGHIWWLAVPLGWFWVLRRRFPVGSLRWRELRAWVWPWVVVAIFVAGLNVIVTGMAIARNTRALGPGWHHTVSLEPLLAELVFRLALVGLAEEFLFRGLIQTGLNRSLPGALTLGRVRLRSGTIVAALLFGLSHLLNLALGQSLASVLPNVLYAAVLGLIAGYFYDQTNNLWGAVILHNLNDFLAFAVPLALVALSGHLLLTP